MTTTRTVPTYSQTNLELIGFGKTRPKDVQIVYNDTNGSTELVFETPFLTCKDRVMTAPKHPDLHQIDIEINKEGYGSKFFAFIEAFENRIIQLVEEHGPSWFTQKEAIYRSIIRTNSTDSTKTFIRFPIDIKQTGQNIFENITGEPIDFTKIKQGDEVKFILSVPGLWIFNDQFGIVFLVKRVQLRERKEKIEYNYVFSTTNEDEEDVSTPAETENMIAIMNTEREPIKKKMSNTATPIEVAKPVHTKSQMVVEQHSQKKSANSYPGTQDGSTRIETDEHNYKQTRPRSSKIEEIHTQTARPRVSKIEETHTQTTRPHVSKIEEMHTHTGRPRISKIEEIIDIPINNAQQKKPILKIEELSDTTGSDLDLMEENDDYDIDAENFQEYFNRATISKQ